MIPQFDEKGKIYTAVIPKDPVTATIQTLMNRIHGELYVRPGERLKDGLNNSEELVAVTNALVYGDHDQILYRCNFLLVNRNQIVWLIPDEELLDIQSS